jgi:hypothetical protein
MQGADYNSNGKIVRIILLAFKSLPRVCVKQICLDIVTSGLHLAVVGELRKWLRRAYNPYTYKNSAFT